MQDPVVAIDGFTYERESVEYWFREQGTKPSGDVRYTSPVTGERLQSTLVIPNTNLAKAITYYLGIQLAVTLPKSKGSNEQPESDPLLHEDEGTRISLQFSHWTIGKAITLDHHRSVITKSILPADRADWYDLIAFSAFPSRFTVDEKPRVLFQVEKARTGWGGLTFGFSPLAPDQIKTGILYDFIDAYCWWLDGSNWFHTPNGGTVLVPWSTSDIKQGDRVGIIVPSHGRFCVYVNGVKKVDLKETDLPVKIGTQLYGFVALTGGYDRVRIIQDSPSDWP
jgi:hypothetical protein